jgi:hypothetical protein
MDAAIADAEAASAHQNTVATGTPVARQQLRLVE